MKKQIMKMAWNIRKEAARKFGCKVSEVIFSICLKQAWSEFKTILITQKIEKNIQNSEYCDQSGDYWYRTTVNEWERGGHHRLYVNMSYGRSGKWSRKASAYLDLNKMEIVEQSGGNAAERRVVYAAIVSAI